MKVSNMHQLGVILILLLASQELLTTARFVKEQRRDKNTHLVEKGSLRQKKSLGAVLFGAALFASMANIGFDIYLQIKGCCGLYPSACTYQKQFNETRAAISSTSKKIDQEWTAAQNILTYVQSSSARNGEIALAMKRITQVYESIIEAIDPEVINSYNNITEELKQAVAKKNNTILAWTNADLDTAFNSVFQTSLGKLQILSGVIGQVAGATLSYVWNWYKTAKIQTMLRTSYGQQLTNVKNAKALKLLGAIDADGFIKETAVARRSVDVSSSRGAKAVKVAGNVMSVVQIGVEIWMAVLKVEQCKDTRDAIKNALDKIVPEKVEIEALYDEIKDHKQNMSATFNIIKEQISDDEFLGYLGQIKNLSDFSSVQTTKLQQSSVQIQSFINQIGSTTTEKQVFDLQGDLVNALEGITFTLDCYYKKVKTYQVVEDRCKSGTDTLQNIFNTAVSEFDTNSNDCSFNASLSYTNFAAVESYINTISTSANFNKDCPLNSKTKLDLVCTKICTGVTDADIATQVGISAKYVTKFKALCPSTCPLTPAEKSQICLVKSMFNATEDQMLQAYPNSDPDEVRAVYRSCS